MLILEKLNIEAESTITDEDLKLLYQRIEDTKTNSSIGEDLHSLRVILSSEKEEFPGLIESTAKEFGNALDAIRGEIEADINRSNEGSAEQILDKQQVLEYLKSLSASAALAYLSTKSTPEEMLESSVMADIQNIKTKYDTNPERPLSDELVYSKLAQVPIFSELVKNYLEAYYIDEETTKESTNTFGVRLDIANLGIVNEYGSEAKGNEYIAKVIHSIMQKSPNAQILRAGGDEVLVLASKEELKWLTSETGQIGVHEFEKGEFDLCESNSTFQFINSKAEKYGIKELQQTLRGLEIQHKTESEKEWDSFDRFGLTTSEDGEGERTPIGTNKDLQIIGQKLVLIQKSKTFEALDRTISGSFEDSLTDQEKLIWKNDSIVTEGFDGFDFEELKTQKEKYVSNQIAKFYLTKCPDSMQQILEKNEIYPVTEFRAMMSFESWDIGGILKTIPKEALNSFKSTKEISEYIIFKRFAEMDGKTSKTKYFKDLPKPKRRVLNGKGFVPVGDDRRQVDRRQAKNHTPSSNETKIPSLINSSEILLDFDEKELPLNQLQTKIDNLILFLKSLQARTPVESDEIRMIQYTLPAKLKNTYEQMFESLLDEVSKKPSTMGPNQFRLQSFYQFANQQSGRELFSGAEIRECKSRAMGNKQLTLFDL